MYKNEEIKSKFYVVRGLGMANYLAKKGFDIKKVEDNVYDRRFKVFLFEDCYELRQAMDNYK